MRIHLLLTVILCLVGQGVAQAPATVVWQVSSFDISATVQQNERTLNVVAQIEATNVGSGPGRTQTLRLNAKASVKAVTVGGAAATFGPGSRPRADLQRTGIPLLASA